MMHSQSFLALGGCFGHSKPIRLGATSAFDCKLDRQTRATASLIASSKLQLSLTLFVLLELNQSDQSPPEQQARGSRAARCCSTPC